MDVALAIRAVESAEALVGVAREAADAGFQGLELPVGASGLLTLDTPPSHCHELRKQISDSGLRVTVLALNRETDASHLAASDAAERRRAFERASAALDRAHWLDAQTFVFAPALLGGPGVRYEEVYGRAVESLLALRFEAQQRGVHIACAIRDTRFLLSPTEARAFIDRVNSPFVGLSLDLGALLAVGYPEDWIASLGHRVFHAYLTDQCLGKPAMPCGIGEGEVDWPAVGEALRVVRFTGPLTLLPDSAPHDGFQKIVRLIRDDAK